MRGVGLEFATDRDHEHAYVVRLGIGDAPHLFEQMALGDELAGVAGQDLDDLPLSRGEAHVLAVTTHALGRKVDGEVGRFDDRDIVITYRDAQPARKRAISSSMPNGLLT